jgi:hypothetical protein
VTDTDGEVPWWPYVSRKAGDVRRAYPGKSGWFAGVHSVLFVHRFLGLSYDAPKRTLRFSPLPALGDFAWSDFPMGSDRFSVRLHHGTVTFTNRSTHPVMLEAGQLAPVSVSADTTVNLVLPKP